MPNSEPGSRDTRVTWELLESLQFRGIVHTDQEPRYELGIYLQRGGAMAPVWLLRVLTAVRIQPD